MGNRKRDWDGEDEEDVFHSASDSEKKAATSKVLLKP